MEIICLLQDKLYLRHVADGAARHSRLVLVRPLPENGDLSRVRREPPDDRAQQRRLPATARTQQSKSAIYREIMNTFLKTLRTSYSNQTSSS